jgi:hypothetical protein
MTTIVEAPPEPSHDELEALIEEARRRARRRRLLIGGVVGGVLLLAALVTGLVLGFRGGSGTAVPKGFQLVHARGPVRHLRLENLRDSTRTVDAASGIARPTRTIQELWWNEGTGFVRTVYRQDGRLVADWVEQQCQGTGPSRFCIPPWPYVPYFQLGGVVPRPGVTRRVATGTFRGHRVVWVEQLNRSVGGKLQLGGDQVAFDAVTHQPVALRSIERSGRFKGRTFSFDAISVLPNLPGQDVSFVVPKGGAGRNPPNPVMTVTGQRLPAARAALGRTPLWLGRSFHGQRLAAVVVGRQGQQAQRVSGQRLPAVGFVPFVRFDYGRFAVWEFGRDRPMWYLHSPSAGKLVVTGSDVMFERDGIGVDIRPSGAKFRLDRATALALVKALRPVDG